MKTKKCKKCNLDKLLEEMVLHRKSKDGYKSICKKCTKEYMKEYNKKNYNTNKKEMLEKNKKWKENNSDYHKKYLKEYRENNKEKSKEYAKEYWENNKEKLKVYKKDWNNENKKYHKEYNKDYYLENKEFLKKEAAEYRVNNKNKINKHTRERKKNDPLFKMRHGIGNLILKSIKRNGYSKKSKTAEILGCTFLEFKEYLESKFESWMTWENRGLYNGEINYGWDIDHIIPISSAETEEDVIRLNHFSNLQPLCSKINRDIKKDNY